MNKLTEISIGVLFGSIGASILSQSDSLGIGKLYDSYPIRSDGRVDEFWGELTALIEPITIIGRKDKLPSTMNGIYVEPTLGVSRFCIHSIEFGNWLNQAQRMNFYYGTMVGLRDLAKILNIRHEQIGLNHCLAIFLGARGRGGNAIATFHPRQFGINLTKTNGPGSLAHEYGHAIDWSLRLKFGLNNWPSGGASTRTKIQDTLLNDAGIKGAFEHFFQNLYFQSNGKPSAFGKAMNKLPSGQRAYWTSRVEVWARSFEQYIHFRSIELGIPNKFLTRPSRTSRWPQRKDINRVRPNIEQIIRMTFK